MMRVLFLCAVVALLLLSVTCSAASLEVTVQGLRSNTGDVQIALFNTADDFPSNDGIFKRANTTITDRVAHIQFEDLAPGAYSVAVYHDENRNDEFDQGLFGIPLEDYGFSNNAPVFFGPPSFDQARIVVTEPKTSIIIDIDK